MCSTSVQLNLSTIIHHLTVKLLKGWQRNRTSRSNHILELLSIMLSLNQNMECYKTNNQGVEENHNRLHCSKHNHGSPVLSELKHGDIEIENRTWKLHKVLQYWVCDKPVHIFRFCAVLQYPLRYSLTIHWSMSFLGALQTVMDIDEALHTWSLGPIKKKAKSLGEWNQHTFQQKLNLQLHKTS